MWYRQLREQKERKNKLESEWEEGIWLGHTRCSNEVLVGIDSGVVRAYAIKRREAGGRWSVDKLQSMAGSPQQPDPNKPGLHIPIRIRLESEVPVEMPSMRAARDEETPKRPYLKKYHFEEHGYTEDCEGCSRFASGVIL